MWQEDVFKIGVLVQLRPRTVGMFDGDAVDSVGWSSGAILDGGKFLTVSGPR